MTASVEPRGGLGGRHALGEVGAERLVPAVRGAVRAKEELPGRAGQVPEGHSLTGRCG